MKRVAVLLLIVAGCYARELQQVQVVPSAPVAPQPATTAGPAVTAAPGTAAGSAAVAPQATATAPDATAPAATAPATTAPAGVAAAQPAPAAAAPGDAAVAAATAPAAGAAVAVPSIFSPTLPGAAAAAAAATAPATPSAPTDDAAAATGAATTAPAAPMAPPKSVWEQVAGVVPVPKQAAASATPAPPKKSTLPPANGWVVANPAAPSPAVDPTAIYTDARAAPASSEQGMAARAAAGAEVDSALAPPPAPLDTTGAGAGAGAGSLAAPGAAPPGALDLGTDLGQGITPLGDAAEPAAPAAGSPNIGVFAAGSGPTASGDLPNQYVSSPANALTTDDILLKMSLGNSKEQLLPVANIVRAALANATSTPIDNVYFYDLVTKNSPSGGQPTVDVTMLFRNTQMVAKARQFTTLNDRNQLAGIANNLARRAQLVVRDMKAVPAVGGGGDMKSANYGVINDMSAVDAGNMTAGGLPGQLPAMDASASANATTQAKSAAAGTRVLPLLATALAAAAVVVL